MADNLIDRGADAFGKPVKIQGSRYSAVPRGLGMYPLIDLLRGDSLLYVGSHIVQNRDIDFGAFLYFFNLCRSFDHGMIRNHMALVSVNSQLLVKIVVALFIFLSTATPAGTVSVYDAHKALLLPRDAGIHKPSRL